MKDAAAGQVPVRDLDAAQNPTAWALSAMRPVADGPDAAALGTAIERLWASDVGAEVELGRQLQAAKPLAGVDAMWDALAAKLAVGNVSAAEAIVNALVASVARGPVSVSDVGRHAALAATTPELVRRKVLGLIGRVDPEWLVTNVETMIDADADVTRRRVADALGGLSSGAMATLFGRLEAVTAVRGKVFPTIVGETIVAMVTARRNVGL